MNPDDHVSLWWVGHDKLRAWESVTCECGVRLENGEPYVTTPSMRWDWTKPICWACLGNGSIHIS